MSVLIAKFEWNRYQKSIVKLPSILDLAMDFGDDRKALVKSAPGMEYAVQIFFFNSEHKARKHSNSKTCKHEAQILTYMFSFKSSTLQSGALLYGYISISFRIWYFLRGVG